MRFVEGDRLDDAEQAILNHSWRSHMPHLPADQMGELLAVWEGWYRDEFRLSKPKRVKPVKTVAPTESRGRRLLKVRSGGLCEVSADGCTLTAREWQHRRNRSQQGTWAPSNGLHACRECHAWIHANPTAAHAVGWTVWSYENPVEVPVFRAKSWVYLDDDGSFEPVQKGAASDG